MRRKILFSSFILFIAVAFAAADGGGGMFFGYQTSTYPFLKDNYEIPNNSLGLAYFGGYGYGVSWDQVITGGFGHAVLDTEGSSGIAGGFGGVINGFRILKWPFNLSIVSYTGFGGIYTGKHQEVPNKGFFAVSEEIDVEIGLPVFDWFMPVVYAGYQVTGNIIPGTMFQTFLSYTPVIGCRIAWGSFR